MNSTKLTIIAFMMRKYTSAAFADPLFFYDIKGISSSYFPSGMLDSNAQFRIGELIGRIVAQRASAFSKYTLISNLPEDFMTPMTDLRRISYLTPDPDLKDVMWCLHRLLMHQMLSYNQYVLLPNIVRCGMAADYLHSEFVDIFQFSFKNMKDLSDKNLGHSEWCDTMAEAVRALKNERDSNDGMSECLQQFENLQI